MVISQNHEFDDSGRWSWKFRNFSKNIKIIDTSLYLSKKTNFIEFRVGTTKILRFEVGDFSKISDFPKNLWNFRTDKSVNLRESVSKSENLTKFEKSSVN